MAKSYWTRIQTPNGLKYFRADDVTDELLQKIKNEANDVFYVEYGVTTYADALAAYNAGKSVLLLKTSGPLTYIYKLVSVSSTAFRFSKVDGQLQDTVGLNSANQYSDTHTSLAKTDNVMKTASAEIAPEYYDLCTEYQTEHKFPIPAGTVVTYLNNTSSDVLQYLYKSKVEIDENDYASSDPITAPAKWDKIHVSDELSKNVVYVDILQTPFSEVLTLYNQGQNIVARYGYEFYRMTTYSESYGAITGFSFQNISGPVIYTWTVTSEGPSETNNWETPPSIYFNSSIYNIATPYDETSTYSVGDIVSYNSNIYRCTTDISVAESWTDAHWTQTTVADELNRLKNEQPISIYSFSNENYPSGNDIWNDVSNGKMVILKRTIMYTRYVYIISSFGSFGNQRDVYFTCLSNYTRLNLHTSNSGASWSWTEIEMYDSSLSSTGINAVQNKTLYGLINDLQARVTALEDN